MKLLSEKGVVLVLSFITMSTLTAITVAFYI